MKKYFLFILIILFFVIIYFFFINKEKSYSINYTLNDYNIVENYDKDNKYYNFEIKSNEINIDFIYEGKYTKNRKIINDTSNIIRYCNDAKNSINIRKRR